MYVSLLSAAAVIFLTLGVPAAAQNPVETKPGPAAPAAKSPAPATPQKTQAAEKPAKPPDYERELQRASDEAGGDTVARIRGFEQFLKRFPEAPQKAAIYRALVEAAMQVRDTPRALDYAERLIAIRPDDSSMLLFAVDLLEKLGDDASLRRAAGYATRVLDRVEKDTGVAKPVRVSQEEWAYERKRLITTLYLIRGRLEMQRKNYDAAVADLEQSFRLLPNMSAALRLGEIADLRKQPQRAVEHYLAAFVLPATPETEAEQRTARLRLGNAWKLLHGSEAGLGERILAAYDARIAQSETERTPHRNAGATELFSFQVRRTKGEALPLASAKGKVMVMYFWATWCAPCREMEPLVEAAFHRYEKAGDVVFLGVNRDEDETLVAPFVEREKVKLPVVFSDGLERLLRIEAIPTVLVFDGGGAIVFRMQGAQTEGFLDAVTAAIESARKTNQPPAAALPKPPPTDSVPPPPTS